MKRLPVVAGFTAFLCHGQQREGISGSLHAESKNIKGLVYVQWTGTDLSPRPARQFCFSALNPLLNSEPKSRDRRTVTRADREVNVPPALAPVSGTEKSQDLSETLCNGSALYIYEYLEWHRR